MFKQSEVVVKELGKLMSLVHERYEGKEHKELREELLKPLRLLCVKMHLYRIDLNKDKE